MIRPPKREKWKSREIRKFIAWQEKQTARQEFDEMIATIQKYGPGVVLESLLPIRPNKS